MRRVSSVVATTVLVAGVLVVGSAPAASAVTPVQHPAAAPAATATADDGSLTSVGTDFWMTFPVNAGGEGGSPALTLSISGDVAGTGTVSAPPPGGSGEQTFTVTPGEVTQVAIDPGLEVQATDGIEAKGVHLTSTVPVSVYGTSHVLYTSSGWLGLPTTSLGRSYRVLGYTTGIPMAGLASQLNVVGTVDGTTVTVTPATAIGGHPAGVAFTRTLNRGDSYQLQATTRDADVSGTTIVATAPVAVMGGNGCADIPTSAAACDQVEQQMTPVSTWGTHFATVRYATRTKGDTYRVLANEDNTVVSVGGTPVATLGAGEFYEAVLPADATTAGNDGVQIDATKPVEVAQYGNGTTFDSTTGDPLMLLVPPTGEYLDHYTISAPALPDGGFTPYASVVVPTADAGAVLLDGVAIPVDQFAPIGTSGYSGAQLSITTGAHSFTGPNPFGLQVYEWGETDGFGYPGGTALIRISGPAESPAPPTTAVASPGNRSVTVTWSAPADDGGSAVTSYTVQAYANGQAVDGGTCTLASPFTPPLQCTVENLTNGVDYTFTVTATNAVGTGPASAASAAVAPDNSTPVTAPGAPTAVTAAAGDGQASVSLTAPANDGGADIASYTVQAYVNGDPVAGRSCTLTSPFTPPLSCVVAGLTNGTSYTFRATATNSAGTGPSSAASAAVVPAPAATAPDAPATVEAAAGDGRASVVWSAPVDDGGSAVTSYTVQALSGGTAVEGATCTLTAPFPSPLTCTVTGLDNGTSYTFAVTATNGVGSSSASDPSNQVTPTPAPTAPAAPTGAAATAGDGQAAVSWTAPERDGGAPIASYTVQAYAGGDPVSGRTCTVTAPFGTPLTCTVTGLTNGTAYTFRVTAANSVGSSAASGPSAAVTPTAAPQVPAAAGNLATVAGDGSVDVSWSAPESDGGAPIRSYTVQARVNGQPVAGRTCTVSGPFTARPHCTVTGLTNGTAYTFTVVATNSVGDGATSVPSDTVTPIPASTAPGSPRGVRATAGDGRATVSWSAPSGNGGSAITAYTVQAYSGGVAVAGRTCTVTVNPTSPARALTCAVTGLRNGTAYTFRVSATNAVGAGTASAASAAVTPNTPGVAPVLPRSVPNARVGTAYTGSVAVTSGTAPVGYRFASGVLPPGISLNAGTGALTGRPTTAGRFVFGIRAANRAGAVSRAFAIVVSPAVTPPRVTPPTAPRAVRTSAVDEGLRIGFIAPASTGGAAIRGYQASVDGGRSWHAVAVTGTRPLHTALGGLQNDHRYRVLLRAVNAAGAGAAVSFLATPGWFTDQINRQARAAEVAVPANPNSYRGRLVSTVALNRNGHGQVVVAAGFAAGRRLMPGQGVVVTGAEIFDFDSATLKPGAEAELRQVVSSVRGARSITCEGYADYGSGVVAHETRVSDVRAHTVCSWLLAHGARVGVSTAAYGPARPVVIGGTPTGREANRRVVITVTR
ncbi:fibronectin type III domain-containing protein [Nakamurella endophytica]|uniref:Fibronectin type III domain protein n=1 Tax=Nakamurella endophytica TaxID=1748367 RepID=A0A917SQD0_9ACTN|nr:fibronectin type III domain-containing protein [Nakamurella endophytica]GGL92494.1 hypothetical protein GCM10011594_10310 [Nakamurella endophytica]